MKITPTTNLETLLTGVQGKIQGSIELAVKQVAAQQGSIRGAQGYNAAVHAGLDVISSEITNVLSEMKRFQPSEKQWGQIRDRCKLFVEIQHKEVLRVAAERTFFKNSPSTNNNKMNLWLENTYGSINNFIDVEIIAMKNSKKKKWETRLWDLFKISIGVVLGYFGAKIAG